MSTRVFPRPGFAGMLLIPLALALAVVPERLPGPAQLDAELQRLVRAISSAPAPARLPAVLKLPSWPDASPGLQLSALERLTDSLPQSRARLLWLPDASLQAALLWSPAGQALDAALVRAGAVREPARLPRAEGKDWRAWLASRPGESAEAAQLVCAAGETVVASPLLRAYLSMQPGPEPRWLPGVGLLAGQRPLTGPDGRAYPRWPPYRLDPEELRPETLPATAAELVVVGALGDPAVDAAAAGLAALLSDTYSYTPWWSGPLEKALILLLLAHFLLVLPRLAPGTGFLLTLLPLIGLLAAQFGLELARSQWLSLAGAQLMLLAGYPLAALNARAARAERRLRLAAEDAALSLAAYQLRQGELEPARKRLLELGPTPARLEPLYELAIAYERRRQYAQAREVFAVCFAQDRGYRDVRERLEVLAQVGPVGVAGLAGAATLVMPESALEKPVLGRYRLERELGRGAMGVVYLGMDPKVGREVAIKTLDLGQLSGEDGEEFKLRFFREAEAAGRLSHPHIVTVYDVGEEGELAFIAMEYAAGRPLSEFTGAEDRLPVETVYRLMAQVAEALDYAHREGVIHRDIKPSNLIYDPARESVKITDFGIARISDSRRTSTGTFLGSPSYMSPEQIAGGDLTGAADLFSLGVSFYQLLSGRLPFEGESLAQLAWQISQGMPRRLPPGLPVSASRILSRALAKDPADRYGTGAEMAEALRRGLPRRRRAPA